MTSPAELIAYIGRQMFERRLTDFSGGNISMREGDKYWITPRYAGSKQHWNLDPSDILSGFIDSDELFDDPRFSREGKAHIGIYRALPEAQAVIHSHPFYVLPFCVAEQPIVPVLESVEKFESIDVIPYAAAHSQELADNIINGLGARRHVIDKQAAAVLMAKHGIIAAGVDLYAALDAIERINWNAWCILAQKMLVAPPVG